MTRGPSIYQSLCKLHDSRSSLEGSRCHGAPLFIRPSAQVFVPLQLQQAPLQQRHARSARHYLTVFYLDFPLKGTSEQSSLTLPSAHRGSSRCSWKYKTNISLSEKGIYLGDKQADGVVCVSKTNRATLGALSLKGTWKFGIVYREKFL